MRNPAYLLFGLILLMSCEKELNIEPKNPGQVLAVDASIENDAPPQVILTNSFKYFSTLSLAQLSDAFVRGAKVTIDDGMNTTLLKEYAFPFGSGSIVFYTSDSTLGPNRMLGKLNTAYTLTIEVGGQTYTAKTTIPPLKKTVDSLWWKPAPENPDTNRVVLFTRVTDPPGLGDFIRYFTSRNDSAFLPGFNSVFDDRVIDGTTYEIQVDRGVDRNQPIDREEYGFFRRGDTVVAKLANIDKAHYDFWRTWEQAQTNLGNPFGVPVKIMGNISNGGLGYFGGYAAQQKTLLIPK